MNILVTGTNGFIGSNVASYLRKKGEYVIGLGRSKKANYENCVDEYISCDLATDDVYDINKNSKKKIDAIVHLAADMRKEPHCVEVVEANCGGTQRLLEFAELNDISVFLQLSSLPVIGHPVEHPITENHPLNPYTVYHITKHTEEMLAEYAYQYHNLRTASFRISAPIGKRVNEKTIFPTFVRKCLNNEDIEIWGKGTRQQNYVHVDDIAQALYKSLYNDNAHGVYNLTGDLLISNIKLAQMCKEILNSKSNIVFNGKDDYMDSYVWDASLEKIKNDINYNPSVTMEQAIKEYAEWLGEK